MSILGTTLPAFLLALGLLIVFHELGHYAVARLCGVRVLRFSVGFGKPLWSRRFGRDGTEWSIGAFPLGGYVKMLDEREAPVDPAELHRAFNRQGVWRRVAIVVAGPAANFLLAVVVYWALFVHGIPGVRPAVDLPRASTPAAAARFEAGEIIRAVDDVPVRTWQELRWVLLERAVERSTVAVEVEGLDGGVRRRSLDLSRLDGDALDASFIEALGIVPYQPPLPPVIGEVLPGSVAESAGLRPGDEVTAADGQVVERWEDAVRVIRAAPGRPVSLTLVRGGAEMRLEVVPAAERDGDATVGRIGVKPRRDPEATRRYQVEVRHGLLEGAWQALRRTWEASAFTLEMMGRMVVGQVSLRNLSGPLTIADYAGQSAQMGWLPYASFVALVSISLGVLNLLPVPLLDGGHLMYYLIEIIKGRPVSERAMEMGQRVGMALLFSMMAFAIYNDLQRLLLGS